MSRKGAGRPCPWWWVGMLIGGVAACAAPAPERLQPLPEPAEAPLSEFLERYPIEVGTPAAPSAEGEERVLEAEPAPVEEPTLHLRGVALTEDGGGVRLDLSRSPTAVNSFSLADPPRLVIDALGPVGEIPAHEAYPVDGGGVRQVRVGRHEDRLRLVLDLESGETPAFTVEQEGARLVARLTAGRGTGEREPSVGEREEAQAGEVVEAPEADAAAEAPASEEAERGAESPAAVTEAAPASEGHAPEPQARVKARRPKGGDDQAARRAETKEAPEPARLSMMLAPAPEPPAAPVPPAAAAPSEPGSEGEGRAEKKQYTGQKISLDFKGADIHNVLRILAEVSGLNLVATDDVEGQVTLRLIDVPWDRALDIILEANGLGMVRDGNVARISTVDRLRAEREALLAAEEAQKELEPLKIDYIRVNYVHGEDIAKLITEEQKQRKEGILSERGYVSVNEATNTLVVRDIQQGIDNVREMVRRLDVRIPQVLIESNIVEATRDFARDLGIQWGYRYSASPETGNAPKVNFPGRIGIGGSTQDGEGNAVLGAGGVPFLANFPANVAGTGTALDLLLGSIDGSQSLAARLSALETKGKARIISRPRVITLNGVPARIESATIFRVRLPQTGTVVATGAGGVAGGGQVATEEIRTGIRLIVTPNVSDDGFVLLDIEARSSTPDRTQAVDEIPAEITREANSHVLVQDGQTVVLGGVFRNELFLREEGVPYLRSLPGLGWFFRRKSRSDKFEELVVFITPRILIAPETASLPSAEALWRDKTGK